MAKVYSLREEVIKNELYRKVLETTSRSQLVLMSLLPYQDIGEEKHNVDQFIMIEEGAGIAKLNGKNTSVSDGTSIFIPAGTKHNIINNINRRMQLYTIYSPYQNDELTVEKYRNYGDATGGTIIFVSREIQSLFHKFNIDSLQVVWRNNDYEICLYKLEKKGGRINYYPIIYATRKDVIPNTKMLASIIVALHYDLDNLIRV